LCQQLISSTGGQMARAFIVCSGTISTHETICRYSDTTK
jgi:hypothetical protein